MVVPFKLPVRLFEVRLSGLELEIEVEWLVLRAQCGVGGGEVPSLFRSFLVMGGRE